MRRFLLSVPFISFLIVLAAATTGFVVGWTTGQAGLESAVLAAVLPVILAGVGGSAGAILIRRVTLGSEAQEGTGTKDRLLTALMAGAVLLFSASFLLGTASGEAANEAARIRESNEADKVAAEKRKIHTTQRYEYLVRCTNELVRLNNLRRKASSSNSTVRLEPLTTGQVCIALRPPISSRPALIALTNNADPMRLSSETEKKTLQVS